MRTAAKHTHNVTSRKRTVTKDLLDIQPHLLHNSLFAHDRTTSTSSSNHKIVRTGETMLLILFLTGNF